MSGVLIVYGTRYGATRGVAEAIAEALRSRGMEADVRPASTVSDLSAYAAAVVGGGLYVSRWHPDALAFVERHRQALATVPVACFALGMAFLRQGEDAERQRTAVTIQVRERVDPVDVAFFAGSTSGLSFLMRALTRLMGSPQGDHRDWEAVRAWADALVPELAA